MYETVKPWSIYRNENQIAQADSHSQVARIVRQLGKLYPHDKITARCSTAIVLGLNGF